ncbi:MAG: lytic transglycosylase domain-containing protein [Bacteroidota bacterium]|nr:lytic transglycosylase domain-containing protein [Bacteroidota bacterium]
MRRLILVLAVLSCCLSLSAQGYPGRRLHLKSPAVPAYVVFAGDTIRLNTLERRERMDRELLTFTNMHSTSILMLKRSLRYFTLVTPLLREQGIPEDLKYLMVIESNLDPKAVSVAGAAGLWQFTKETAKTYKLLVNSEVDERFDITKETLAACTYLKRSYAKFHDWMTVAASYNAGQQRLVDRIAEQGETCGLDLWLPEETMRYMYRLLTAKLFFENPQSFGFDVPMEERYPYVPPKKTVLVSDPIEDLAAFAKEHGTTYARLKNENLWLRDTKLLNKENRSYIILIPADK